MRNPVAEEKFLIHELAEQARTTVRTIRYYTDEGLLPQPEVQGKFAYYTQNHLDRLQLIRRMKDAYLPLREIRQIMTSLTNAEVSERLKEQFISDHETERGTTPPPPRGESGTKALEYISRLIEEQSRHRSNESPVVNRSLQPALKNAPAPAREVVSESNFSPEEETWQRISLTTGVELHLRTPADMDTADRVRQLIAFAKKLFR